MYVHAPDRNIVGVESHRSEGNRNFRHPSLIGDPGSGIPLFIPVVVHDPAFIIDQLVAQSAQSVHPEPIAITMVMEGVEHELDHVVAFHFRVAPKFRCDDARWVRVEAFDSEIDVVRVEKNPDLGLFRSKLGFTGVALPEVGDGVCEFPAALIKNRV